MMTAKQPLPEGHSFAAERITRTSAKAALLRVRSLAAAAPPGRSFDAVATIADITRRIESSLSASDEALQTSDEDWASLEWARAIVMMERLTAEATSNAERREPAYLRRRVQSEI
jgi:hypothetical protein